MQYTDDMINLFVANYTFDYPVKIVGLGEVKITAGVVTPTTIDESRPWLELSFTPLSTFNATIGTRDSRLKRELFFFNVQMHIPRTTYTSDTIYTYATFTPVVEELDYFLITDGFTASGQEGLIYSDQVEVKTSNLVPVSDKDTWISLTLGYNYVYQYI